MVVLHTAAVIASLTINMGHSLTIHKIGDKRQGHPIQGKPLSAINLVTDTVPTCSPKDLLSKGFRSIPTSSLLVLQAVLS